MQVTFFAYHTRNCPGTSVVAPFLATADLDSGPPRSTTPTVAIADCAGRRLIKPIPRPDSFWDSHCDSTQGPSTIDMGKTPGWEYRPYIVPPYLIEVRLKLVCLKRSKVRQKIGGIRDRLLSRMSASYSSWATIN